MSSPNHDRDTVAPETTALLGEARTTTMRLSPETLFIPVAFALKLSTLLPMTTLLDLVRKTVCRMWNVSHGDPAHLSSDVCDAPEIARDFAVVMMVINAMQGFTEIAACGVLSRVSSLCGRKPAFFFVLAAGVVGNCIVPLSQHMPSWIGNWAVFMGMFLAFAIPYPYLVNSYIADVCDPDNRTAALSRVHGWAAIGSFVSLALGGNITTTTGNPLIVFYTAAAISAVVFTYVAFVLPEPTLFPMGTSVDDPSETSRFAYLQVFRPLKLLIPAPKLDGTRNWRLAWCAVHVFLYMAASAYAMTAWMVFATAKYHLTPADTGLFLTVIGVSSTVTLTVIVPLLLRILRPYYIRTRPPLLVEDDTTFDEESKQVTSERLDVHLAFIATVIGAFFISSAAASRTKIALMLSAACIGLTAAHTPTTRSLVAASVDPLKQGEALAAIEMVSHAGALVSPLIMGSILTATIGTAPMLVFHVHLVAVLVCSSLLFLIRDVDGYQRPREE